MHGWIIMICVFEEFELGIFYCLLNGHVMASETSEIGRFHPFTGHEGL